MSEVNILTFNILSSLLSSNPFEFESLYLDDSTLNKNMRLLFNLWDGIFNPKSKEHIPFKVKWFFRGESAKYVSKDSIAQLITKLTEAGAKNPERIENMGEMEVIDLISLVDKANKEHLHKGWILSAIDRSNTLNTFQNYNGPEDLEAIRARLDSQGEDQFQWMFDLMFRKTLKAFQDLLYFNEELNVKNVKLIDEHFQKAMTVLPKTIQHTMNGNFLEEQDVSENQKEFIKEVQREQNANNTPQGKFKVIIDQVNTHNIHLCCLIEIYEDFYNNLDEMLNGTNFDYFPKNFKFQNKKDLLTLTLQNKIVISNVTLHKDVSKKNKIISFTRNDNKFLLAQLHLEAGEEFKEDRINTIEKVLKGETIGSNFYLCGDLNEHLDENSELLMKLKKEQGFKIESTEMERLKQNTCDKMRSAGQYQVNKMRKPDKSTKDLIVGTDTVEDYKVVYQKISDHKMVIGKISVN